MRLHGISLFLLLALVGCKSSTTPQESVALITPHDSIPVLPETNIHNADTSIEMSDEYDADTMLYNAVASDVDAAIGDIHLQTKLDSVKSLL